VRATLLLPGLALALAAGACGDVQRAADGTASAPAPRLEQRVAVSGDVPRARPADFRAPIARYRAHVRRELTAMAADVAALRAALARGDLAGARGAWLAADGRYESIGAAYGAFGPLDAAIDGRPGVLQGGVRSARFDGLHRVELALWGRRSTADARAPAARLARDVARLRSHVGSIAIDPLDYALRAHEVLEDTLQLQLAGVASPWASAALVALEGNVRGTDVVLGSLRPLVVRRNPRVLAQAQAALARLRAELRRLHRRGGGALPRWDALPRRERERVAGLTAAAAEQLAFVPELIDPRPPRRPQRALGTELAQ